jgi:hypothetical protein
MLMALLPAVPKLLKAITVARYPELLIGPAVQEILLRIGSGCKHESEASGGFVCMLTSVSMVSSSFNGSRNWIMYYMIERGAVRERDSVWLNSALLQVKRVKLVMLVMLVKLARFHAPESRKVKVIRVEPAGTGRLDPLS